MAQIEVEWTETVRYRKEVTVDGYDGNEDDLLEVIVNLDEEAAVDALIGVEERLIGNVRIISDGEAVPVIPPAKQREDMF